MLHLLGRGDPVRTELMVSLHHQLWFGACLANVYPSRYCRSLLACILESLKLPLFSGGRDLLFCLLDGAARLSALFNKYECSDRYCKHRPDCSYPSSNVATEIGVIMGESSDNGLNHKINSKFVSTSGEVNGTSYINLTGGALATCRPATVPKSCFPQSHPS